MKESQLRTLPVTELLTLAYKAMDLYADAPTKKLAAQREADLIKLHKIITEKRANEKPLK